jgi:hypothetical protein
VTGGAINTRLFGLVTIDAGTHRDVTFEIEPVALGNLSVTLLASAPRCEVRPVAEDDVGGNLIDARPPDLAVVFGEPSKLLNLRAIRPDLCMALHATQGSRNTHLLARVWIWMTPATLQLQCPSVHLVAEGNGLLRRCSRLFGLRCGCQDTRDQDAESQENPQ